MVVVNAEKKLSLLDSSDHTVCSNWIIVQGHIQIIDTNTVVCCRFPQYWNCHGYSKWFSCPKYRECQSLSILEITTELSRLQQLASDNKLSPEDISGGTITLSNIGSIGRKFGSPLLNLPEVSIIAIGRIQKVPKFADDENVYPAPIMTVNIGADYRVLDGATVARLCNEWKQFIENPELLVLHMR